ncbi:MAG: cation diffusion facilitator family transporter [Candidatus Hydrogenedentota bacterium]
MTAPSHAKPRDGNAHMYAVRRVTVAGLFMNLLLAGTKCGMGILGHSQALVADAVHSLTDCLTDLVVILGAPLWSAPADENHPYGHGRIETLVTVIIGISLGAAGLSIAYNALVSLSNPADTQPGWLAFAGACLSIAVKETLYQWTVRTGQRVRSSALAANAWHHRTDALSSVPVALAVLGTQIQPAWIFLDQIGAILVALMILQATWHIVRPALDTLIDRGATAKKREYLRNIAAETAGVEAIHAFRTRDLGNGLSVDLHVLVPPQLTVGEGHDIAGAVKARLLTDDDVVDVLVHIEPFDPEHHKSRSSQPPTVQ